ncbi:MAG: universal stress protein [Hyphomicrobiaceae bacterium]
MVHTKRRVFEEGHRRKFLVIVDGTPECEVALFFAARVAQRTNGSICFMHIADTSGSGGWSSFGNISKGAGEERAQQMFRLYREKLMEFGFEDLHTETVFREGKKADEITRFIESDEDVAVLVLGAASDRRGPGPIVSALGTGRMAGEFPVPIYIVPGTLTLEEIGALA